MERVGVRALQQHASAVLRRVEAGERIEVTDRGRPVALLIPAPTGGAIDRLRAQGRLIPARRSSLPDPIAPEPGQKALSEVLAEMREHER